MTVLQTMHSVLEPYIPECRYLKDIQLAYPEARGSFEIPKPFYCVKTGHFNAVELMICYNQLTYSMFGEWFNEGIIPQVGKLSLEDYRSYQAGSCYIARVDDLKFSRPICPESFTGTLQLQKTAKRGSTVFFTTSFEFNDTSGGRASGKTLLALVLGSQVAAA